MAIGSSLRLPLVITRGRPTASSSRTMERCRGEHEADGVEPRGHRRAPADCPAGRPAERSGRSAARSSRASRPLTIAMRAGLLEGPDHHGERLGLPPLPAPQLAHRGFTGGVAGQVKAAEPAECHDPSVGEQGGGPGQRGLAAGLHLLRPRALEPERRSAGRAAVGLGVMPPIAGRVVLARRKPGTARRRPSSSVPGRTAAGSMTVKRGPQSVQVMKG